MSLRKVSQLVRALEVTEGAGVSVYRSLGTPARRNLDPFLLLDQFSTHDPDDYIAGFPEHPHRGFSTFTYMLDGHMEHRDSMGNSGDLLPGGAQWMKAGSGVIHAEMPRQTQGRMRGFQLWINLPADKKMTAPAYQDIRPESIPVVTGRGWRLHLPVGEYGGQQGPVSDPDTAVQYLDVVLEPGHSFSHESSTDRSAFIYPFEGEAMVAGTRVPIQHLAVLGAGAHIVVQPGNAGARFLLVSGKPINEPVVQHGPFVMNTREEIEQAYADLRDGRLVQTG